MRNDRGLNLRHQKYHCCLAISLLSLVLLAAVTRASARPSTQNPTPDQNAVEDRPGSTGVMTSHFGLWTVISSAGEHVDHCLIVGDTFIFKQLPNFEYDAEAAMNTDEFSLFNSRWKSQEPSLIEVRRIIGKHGRYEVKRKYLRSTASGEPYKTEDGWIVIDDPIFTVEVRRRGDRAWHAAGALVPFLQREDRVCITSDDGSGATTRTVDVRGLKDAATYCNKRLEGAPQPATP